jgi:hypothetical protein
MIVKKYLAIEMDYSFKKSKTICHYILEGTVSKWWYTVPQVSGTLQKEHVVLCTCSVYTAAKNMCSLKFLLKSISYSSGTVRIVVMRLSKLCKLIPVRLTVL